MKKRLLIGKLIGFIGIIIFAMGISYIFTYFKDKAKYQDINLLVVFEDTKTFKIDKLQEKEETLKEYPYKFTIKNNNKVKTKYEIIIKDNQELDKTKLNYILYKNDQVLQEDNLKNNIIIDEIEKNSENNYSLYIYSSLEGTYEYSIEIISK